MIKIFRSTLTEDEDQSTEYIGIPPTCLCTILHDHYHMLLGTCGSLAHIIY